MIQEQGDGLGITHRDLEYLEIGKTPVQEARFLMFLIAQLITQLMRLMTLW